MTPLGAISVRVWVAVTVMTGLYAAVLQQINAVQPLPYMVNQAAARGQRAFSVLWVTFRGHFNIPLEKFFLPHGCACPQIPLRLHGFACTPTCICIACLPYSVTFAPPSLPWTTFLKQACHVSSARMFYCIYTYSSHISPDLSCPDFSCPTGRDIPHPSSPELL